MNSPLVNIYPIEISIFDCKLNISKVWTTRLLLLDLPRSLTTGTSSISFVGWAGRRLHFDFAHSTKKLK